MVELMNTGHRFPLYRDLRWYEVPDDLLRQTAKFVEYVIELNPDVIFFLDKGAQPIAYMLSVALHRLSLKRPEIRFVNIGREANERKRKFRVTSYINSIRKIYGKHIKTDGTLLVVDEYKETGFSLNLACYLIGQAFPEARIIPYAVYTFLPPWYGVLWYLGVRDWTEDDYKAYALEVFNKSVGEEYKTPDEIPEDLKPIFDEIYDEALSIPYTRPFKPHTNYYGNGTLGYNPAVHNINNARRELRLMAETMLNKYINKMRIFQLFS